jgi:hypothetical protein
MSRAAKAGAVLATTAGARREGFAYLGAAHRARRVRVGLTELIGSRATRPLAAAGAVLATLSTVTIAIALISPPDYKTLREART